MRSVKEQTLHLVRAHSRVHVQCKVHRLCKQYVHVDQLCAVYNEPGSPPLCAKNYNSHMQMGESGPRQELMYMYAC